MQEKVNESNNIRTYMKRTASAGRHVEHCCLCNKTISICSHFDLNSGYGYYYASSHMVSRLFNKIERF